MKGARVAVWSVESMLESLVVVSLMKLPLTLP